MSVVAAAALLDRVFISADCRVTEESRQSVHYDHTLKLFQCGPWTVIGFVADDVKAAAVIVQRLLQQTLLHRRFTRQEDRRKRVPWHPTRLHRWIPRLLRNEYAKTGSKKAVSFVLASVISDVSSVVSSRVASDLLRAAKRAGRQTPQWAADVLAATHQAGLEEANVSIRTTGTPRLMVLKSPTFLPYWFGGPLSFAAIGMGGVATTREAQENRAHLFGAEPQMARLFFDILVHRAARRAGIGTVGGVYPMYEITASGAVPLNLRTSSSRGVVELIRRPNGHWIQRSSATGSEIEIMPPWRTLGLRPMGNRVFEENPYPWFQ